MIAVTVVTALIATIAHLDGTTAVTVLITIPAMYPVYKKMNIDSRILLCLTGASMGVMNLLPWGGPTARAATVLAMDATELWHADPASGCRPDDEHHSCCTPSACLRSGMDCRRWKRA